MANKYLTEKVDQLRAQGLTNLSFKVIEGGIDGAAAEIIDAAQKISGSVIAMTRHGQTGIGRWLIGSITDRVVRHLARRYWWCDHKSSRGALGTFVNNSASRGRGIQRYYQRVINAWAMYDW